MRCTFNPKKFSYEISIVSEICILFAYAHICMNKTATSFLPLSSLFLSLLLVDRYITSNILQNPKE